MNTLKPILISLFFLILSSCGSNAERDFEKRSSEVGANIQESAPTEEVESDIVSSSAAVVSKDTSRKFIRTADLKFRVKDVRIATTAIEDITAHFDGFVTYTYLTSSISKKELTPISRDSSLETIYYSVRNEMTIRVPNESLDTTLRTMAAHIDYLDHRTIIAQDVTLSLVANNLAQNRLDRHNSRLTNTIDNQGKKLKETTSAEENLLNKQEQKDKVRLSTLNIQDQVDYSTISLNIYQRHVVKRDIVENYRNINAFQPSFGSQLVESIKNGWYVLKLCIVGMMNLWPLIVLALLAWVLYIRYKKKK